MHRKRGIMSSGLLFQFWALLLVLAIPQFRSEIVLHGHDTDPQAIADDWKLYRFTVYMLYFSLVVLQTLSHCFADKTPAVSTYSTFANDTRSKPCPEVKASFVNKIFYLWFDPMAWYGYRNPLTTDDVYDLNPEDRTIELLPTFDHYWKESVERGQRQLQKKHRKNGEKGPTSKRTNVCDEFPF